MNNGGNPDGTIPGGSDTAAPAGGKGVDWRWAAERVRDMLVKPKETWRTIKGEPHSITEIYQRYIFLLAAVQAICTFLGYLFVGFAFFAALFTVALQFLLTIAVLYVLALVIEFLVPKFDGSSTREESFKLLAYSYTPLAAASILSLFPFLGHFGTLLKLLILVYTVYLIWLGIPELARVPEDKRPVFTVAVVVAAIILLFVFGLVLFVFGLGSFWAMR